MGTRRFTRNGYTGNSNIFGGMALPGGYSFGLSSSAPTYNPGYMSAYSNSYTNSTGNNSTGFRFQNGTSYLNGIPLDLGLFDDQIRMQDAYFNRRAEGASHQPFILTDPHYFIDGEKENEGRDDPQLEIDEDAAFIGR